MKKRHVIFFVGPPGSGKGTQAELLYKGLKGNENEDLFLFDMGSRLREHAQKSDMESHSILAAHIKKVQQEGTLLPAALPIYHWTRAFGKTDINKPFTMIMDGVCRRVEEIPVIIELFSDLKISLQIFFLDTPREVCIERLVQRGREDDSNVGTIKKRLDSFFSSTITTIRILNDQIKGKLPFYSLERINGSKNKEEVAGLVFDTLYFQSIAD